MPPCDFVGGYWCYLSLHGWKIRSELTLLRIVGNDRPDHTVSQPWKLSQRENLNVVELQNKSAGVRGSWQCSWMCSVVCDCTDNRELRKNVPNVKCVFLFSLELLAKHVALRYTVRDWQLELKENVVPVFKWNVRYFCPALTKIVKCKQILVKYFKCQMLWKVV